MITLDTDLLPAAQRAQSWIQARAEADIPSTVQLADPKQFQGRFEHWQLEDLSVSRQTVNSAQRLYRTSQQVRMSGPSKLSISLQESGTGWHEQFGVRRKLTPGQLVCTDLTAPWEYSFTDAGSARALLIDFDKLEVSIHQLRRSVRRLERSPIYESITRQIGQTFDELETHTTGLERPDVGANSVHLIRTLLLFDRFQTDLPSDTRDISVTMKHVRSYVKRHLMEPDLTLDSIAAGLGVAIESLTSLGREAHFDVAKWIISQRLQCVDEDLAFWGRPLRPIRIAAR